MPATTLLKLTDYSFLMQKITNVNKPNLQKDHASKKLNKLRIISS